MPEKFNLEEVLNFGYCSGVNVVIIKMRPFLGLEVNKGCFSLRVTKEVMRLDSDFLQKVRKNGPQSRSNGTVMEKNNNINTCLLLATRWVLLILYA